MPRPFTLHSLLRAFLDLDDLVRHQALGLPMYRFFGWGFGQAEDCSRFFVELVPVILHSVLVLHFEVLMVSIRYSFSGQSFYVSVDVHVQRYLMPLLSLLVNLQPAPTRR